MLPFLNMQWERLLMTKKLWFYKVQIFTSQSNFDVSFELTRGKHNNNYITFKKEEVWLINLKCSTNVIIQTLLKWRSQVQTDYFWKFERELHLLFCLSTELKGNVKVIFTAAENGRTSIPIIPVKNIQFAVWKEIFFYLILHFSAL